MFRFLHAADIHLDSPMVGLDRYETAPVEAMRRATRRSFENLVNLAIEEHVAFVLLAGDLYDGDWKDYRTGLFFVEQMSKLRDVNIPVFVVAGNHDAQSQLTKNLRAPENVYLFSARKPETRVVEDFGVAVHGQGFPARAVTENLAAAYPAPCSGLFNIGLLHTSLDGRDGHDTYAPAAVSDLVQKGYQYWALGHVHTREIVSSDPWIIFAGNLQGRHARETGAKGCTLVTVDGGVVRTVEERFVDVARWSVCRVEINGALTTDDVLDLILTGLKAHAARADGRVLAVRVEIAGATPCHDQLVAAPEHWVEEIRALASSVSSTEVWIERVRVATTRTIDLAAAASRDDALGKILRGLGTLGDEAERAAAGSALADIRAVLPRELLEGDDAVDPRSPAVLTRLLDEARDLLLARISTQGSRL